MKKNIILVNQIFYCCFTIFMLFILGVLPDYYHPVYNQLQPPPPDDGLLRHVLLNFLIKPSIILVILTLHEKLKNLWVLLFIYNIIILIMLVYLIFALNYK